MHKDLERLIEGVRKPKASKKRRKARIDSLPPFLPKVVPRKARIVTAVAKEIAKLAIDLGPEGTDLQPKPLIITRHTQEQLEYEAGLLQEETPMTMKDDIIEILENSSSDVEAEQLAEAIYIQAEQTQNQEMENALASIERRRPRQFNSGRSRQFSRQNLVPSAKKKRKVSAYSKRFGIELKKLKKLHPRTKVQNLMKRAHRQTRMAMKMKR
jgi:hypothetical protein